jgi:hypothetical protein
VPSFAPRMVCLAGGIRFLQLGASVAGRKPPHNQLQSLINLLGLSIFWHLEHESLVLICATEFGKSFEPIVPMVRVGGDMLQVTVAMGCFWAWKFRDTGRRPDAGHRDSNGRGSAVLARRKALASIE